MTEATQGRTILNSFSLSCLPRRMEWRSAPVQGPWSIPSGEKQLQLTRSEKPGVQRLACFVSLIYIRFWHEEAVLNYAPKNDLEFLAILQVFVDRELRSTAEKAL